MSKVYLLDLASQQAKWLSARQTVIASNISNSDTPGYKAMDIKPFSETLDGMQITMASTSAAHMKPVEDDADSSRMVELDSSNANLSGNSVNIEQNLMKEGDINRSYILNTNIKRVFHQMFLSALK